MFVYGFLKRLKQWLYNNNSLKNVRLGGGLGGTACICLFLVVSRWNVDNFSKYIAV
jgi:hypothetical protein